MNSTNYFRNELTKRLLGFCLLFVLVTRLSAANSQEWLWANSYGTTGVNKSTAVVNDGSGNLYVTGFFESAQMKVSSFTLSNQGGRDVFVVKLSKSGTVIWAKSYGGSFDDVPTSLTIDSKGDCIVAGNYISKTVKFDALTLMNTGQAADKTSDIFVAKLNQTTGEVEWATSADGVSNDIVTSVVATPDGECILVGSFVGQDYVMGDNVLHSNGGEDAFVAIIDTSGNIMKAQSFGGVGRDYASSIGQDAQGNVYVCGNYESMEIKFQQSKLTNSGANDFFVVKLNPSGAVVNAMSFGSAGTETVNCMSVMPSGEFAIAGMYSGAVLSFGNTILQNTKPGTNDAFVTIFDVDFSIKSAKKIGGAGDEAAMSIHDSYSSNFLLSFTSSSKYPEIDGEQSAIGTYGKKDIFFATIDISGSIDNVYALGGTEDDEITDAIVTFDGLITLCGGFASSDLYFGNLLKLSSAPGATSAIIASKFKFDPQKNPDVCDKNLVKNGGFEDNNGPGVFTKDTIEFTPKYWYAELISPTIFDKKDGVADSYIALLGSLDLSESIYQKVAFKKGIEYQISFDAKFKKESNDGTAPRFRFIASNIILDKVSTQISTTTSPDIGCIIGESVNVSDLEWLPYTIPNWKAINDYKYLTIVVTSNRKDVDSGYVMGQIDNICIREVVKCPTVTTTPVDKLCCSTNFTLNSDPLYPITSIGYTITGGTVKSMTTSPCIPTGSISVGSSNGKLLFSTPCNKPLNVEFYGIPTSASGNMALNLDIAMGSKGTCMVSIPISCAVPGIKFKDKVSVTPGHFEVTDPLSEARAFKVENLKQPYSPIIKINIHNSGPTSVLVGSKLMIDGREFQWDANRDDIDIPALTNSENLGFSEITFNLGVPKLSTWSGTVSITVLHADGESTEYTYGPWTPNLSKAKGMINSVPNSTKMFISRLRVLNSDIRRKIGWVSLSLRESDARFVAGTGQSWVGTSQSVGQAKIGEYSQGEKDALFKFVNSINPGDSSGYFTTVISSNALVPPQPVVSVYDAGGNLLSTDTSTSYAISTSAEDAQITINPSRLRSLNCTPNPAKENITVRYELKSRTVVHLQLFSYSGEEIKMLESGTQEEGLHMSTFDVSALASGTYIVKLSSAENTISTTLTIVR